MRFEKTSETSFRCVFTAQDLADREIRLEELAYGSAKTRKLFNDVVWEAAEHYGVFLKESPLLVEAIPLRNQGLALEVSVAEDPDELDGRYSEFTLALGSRDEEEGILGADDILKADEKNAERAGKSVQEGENAEDAGKPGQHVERTKHDGKTDADETAGKDDLETEAIFRRIMAELRSNAKKRAPEMKKAVQEGEDRRVKDDLREANFDGEEKRDPEEMQAEPAKGMQKDDAKDDEPQVVNLKEETLGEDVFGEDFEKLRREANRQDDEENLEEDELPVLKEAEEPALPEDPAAAMANELRGKILEGLQKIFPDAHVEAVDLTTVRVSGENLDDAQKQLMRALSEKMKEAARERADKEMALANGGGDQEQNPERAGDAQRRNARRGRTAGRRQMQESLRLFAFDSLEDALSGAANVAFFTGESSLFHDRSGYSLVLRQGQSDLQDFNRVCNILTEYGEGKTATPAAVAYLKEHAQSVFTGDAIAQLVAIEGK